MLSHEPELPMVFCRAHGERCPRGFADYRHRSARLIAAPGYRRAPWLAASAWASRLPRRSRMHAFMIANVLGGIGLFLLGMILMTDGLKSLAGDALRGILARFTGSPTSALLTGAVVTAIVQSSSATTLATIGFVSAGLLPFPQAVGVIFGANVGTTSTSWLVSTLGLKVNVSAVALPLVGIGALARLLGKRRIASFGMALAGFGLVFVGIDTLQAGMAGLARHFDPSMFPGNTLGGRLLLVLVGVGMTVVMQSSSAAAATTLAALHAGALDLSQAAALVIGQNLGTTVTAGVAAIGASLSAKRTALAHVFFNGITGLVAFAILPVFVAVVDNLTEHAGGGDDTTSLAAFHTAFNVLGVVILMPFVRHFSAFVERVVPDRGSPLIKNLDPTVVAVPAVAAEAARRALREVAAQLADAALAWIRAAKRPPREFLDEMRAGLEEIRKFLDLLRTQEATAGAREHHLSALHALDHLDRILDLLEAPEAVARGDEPALEPLTNELERTWPQLVELLRRGGAALPTQGVSEASGHISGRFSTGRAEALREAASGKLSTHVALTRIDAMRWLDRAAYHVARAAVHLDEGPPGPEQMARSSVYPGVDEAR